MITVSYFSRHTPAGQLGVSWSKLASTKHTSVFGLNLALLPTILIVWWMDQPGHIYPSCGDDRGIRRGKQEHTCLVRLVLRTGDRHFFYIPLARSTRLSEPEMKDWEIHSAACEESHKVIWQKAGRSEGWGSDVNNSIWHTAGHQEKTCKWVCGHKSRNSWLQQ